MNTAQTFTCCDTCDCVYDSAWKPEGSRCDDLSGALDHWPLEAPIPTEAQLIQDQCQGICRSSREAR